MRGRVIVLVWLFTGFGSGCATPWKTHRDTQDEENGNIIKRHYWDHIEAAQRRTKVAVKLKTYRVPLPPYEDHGVYYEGRVIEVGWYE